MRSSNLLFCVTLLQFAWGTAQNMWDIILAAYLGQCSSNLGSRPQWSHKASVYKKEFLPSFRKMK